MQEHILPAMFHEIRRILRKQLKNSLRRVIVIGTLVFIPSLVMFCAYMCTVPESTFFKCTGAPYPGTERSDHTGQTNQTFGVNRIRVQYEL